jgi:hypothetical protein
MSNPSFSLADMANLLLLHADPATGAALCAQFLDRLKIQLSEIPACAAVSSPNNCPPIATTL